MVPIYSIDSAISMWNAEHEWTVYALPPLPSPPPALGFSPLPLRRAALGRALRPVGCASVPSSIVIWIYFYP